MLVKVGKFEEAGSTTWKPKESDLRLDGTPLEQIQVLCEHESVTTTEIYVKSRWRGTAAPNTTALTA